MKSRYFLYCRLPVFFLVLGLVIYGCGGGRLRKQLETQIVNVGEKDKYVTIIIDDQHMKDKEYGSDLVANIQDENLLRYG